MLHRLKNIFLICFFSCVAIVAQDTVNQSNFYSDDIISNIKKHLHYLGSDIFEGRGTGTLGGELAAKYLALKFDELNLIPIGDNNTFYQKIPMHGSIPSTESELTIYSDNEEKRLSLFDDYLLFKTGEQTYIPSPLPVIFAGYGITAPEFDYNDYNNIDVEGSIVLVLDGEPISEDSEYFAGDVPTIYSYHESKIRTALSRGAYGCIIIPDSSDVLFSWDKIKREYQFEDVRLAYSATGRLAVILHPNAARFFFENSDYELEDIYEMKKKHSISSFALNTKLSFHGYFNEREFFASNIVGMIRGNDSSLSDEYIILSAHYDHLGIGPAVNQDSIYNGILDNALGTAVAIELARKFKTNSINIRRSIIFLLLTGEEKGLLGSTYYIQNPIVPLFKTITNINIDGVAVFDEFTSIVGVGAEYSTIRKYLGEVADSMKIVLKPVPPEFRHWEAFYKSDQITFAKAGIPSVITMDGLHYKNITHEQGLQKFLNYSRYIYHTPFDDLSIPVNYSAVKMHFDFLSSLLALLANKTEAPEWESGAPYINARLRSIAEKK